MFIIIPVKPFKQAKSRLAMALSPAERMRLSRYLFTRTLHLARQAGETVIVSRDGAARKLAKRAGAWALAEAGRGLNEALRQATAWSIAQGADTILILPGDLPRLILADLTRLVEAGWAGPTVVIAPCHRREGTNGLLLRPPGVIEVAFGPNSFERHQQIARAAGLDPIIYDSPRLAFDLDRPEDLAVWRQRPALCHQGPHFGFGDG